MLFRSGFIVEMDDFGAGYSSLNILKDVPVDILKLDVNFLSKGEDDSKGGHILSSIIRMAHWLNIPVIAEGVETKEQADYLKSLSCVYMQGYYFSKPLPKNEFEKILVKSEVGDTKKYSSTNLEGIAEFWNPSAQMALIFNSFVGGAAILECKGENAEIVRANDTFYHEANTTRQKYQSYSQSIFSRFDDKNLKIFKDMLNRAAVTGEEAECEIGRASCRERVYVPV